MNLSRTQRQFLCELLESAYNKDHDILRSDWRLSDFINERPECSTLDMFTSDGATKNAIIVKKWRIVLKWSSHYENDEAIKEVDIYESAVNNGLEMFFPQTEFFCRIGPYNIVLQEMINFSCADIPNSISRKLAKSCSVCNYQILSKVRNQIKYACPSYCRDMDELWTRRALILYGKRKVKALCKFIKEHQINDLHRNNIGYLNKRPIILDFCGYY